MARESNYKISLSDEDKGELIRLWESKEILYDVEHADYHNKQRRTAALKRIAEDMPVEINHDQVKAVMKSLRTSFLKERRKEEESMQSGKGTSQIYLPTWKFYEELKFLWPYTKPTITELNLQSETSEVRLSETEKTVDVKVEDDESEDNGVVVAMPNPKKTSTNKGRKRKTNRSGASLTASDTIDACTKSQRRRIHASPPVPHSPQEDYPEELFGKTMALLAKRIQDDTARDMAKIECQQVMLRHRLMNHNMSTTNARSTYHGMLNKDNVNGPYPCHVSSFTSMSVDNSPSEISPTSCSNTNSQSAPLLAFNQGPPHESHNISSPLS